MTTTTEGDDVAEQTTASDTLDAIRRGGQQLLTIVRLRMQEAEEALGNGDFSIAAQRIAEAGAMVAPLAAAEGYMAIADGSFLVRVRDMERGMHIVSIGEIDEIDQIDCTEHGGHVRVKVGEEEMNFNPDTQLYVRREDAA